MIKKKILMSEHQLQSYIGELRAAWKEKRYLRVEHSADKPRTLPANALSHVWYEQVSRELGEDSPLAVKAYCKLHFAVPIMRAENELFREVYDIAILRTLSYEQKLKLMEVFPVTSEMTTTQLSKYLEAVREHYKNRVELLYPEEQEFAQPEQEPAAA